MFKIAWKILIIHVINTMLYILYNFWNIFEMFLVFLRFSTVSSRTFYKLVICLCCRRNSFGISNAPIRKFWVAFVFYVCWVVLGTIYSCSSILFLVLTLNFNSIFYVFIKCYHIFSRTSDFQQNQHWYIDFIALSIVL